MGMILPKHPNPHRFGCVVCAWINCRLIPHGRPALRSNSSRPATDFAPALPRQCLEVGQLKVACRPSGPPQSARTRSTRCPANCSAGEGPQSIASSWHRTGRDTLQLTAHPKKSVTKDHMMAGWLVSLSQNGRPATCFCPTENLPFSFTNRSLGVRYHTVYLCISMYFLALALNSVAHRCSRSLSDQSAL